MIKNTTIQQNFTPAIIKNNPTEQLTIINNKSKADTISFSGTQKNNNSIISRIKKKIERLYLNKNAVNLLVENKTEEFNNLRKDNENYYPSIRNKNLQNKNLEGVDFKDTYIINTKFDGTNLTKAVAGFANFENVSSEKTLFNESQCYMAEFKNSNLNDANFTDAHAHFAKFENVKADKIIFSNTDLYSAIFKGTDLSTAKLDGANLVKARFDNIKVNIEELKKTTPETQAYIDKKYVLIDQNNNNVTLNNAKDIVTITKIPGLIY